MKKKIIISASVALIACGAFFGGTKSNINKSTDLMLANVEALADEVGGITCGRYSGDCWKQGYQLRMCGPYNYYECVFSGYQRDSCTDPC